MELLAKIIDGATDASVPVGSLLRSVKVLASRMDQQEFEEWVNLELNGYPWHEDGLNLPPYRAPRTAHIVGQFLLPFTSASTELGIASSAFTSVGAPLSLFSVSFHQSVTELEGLAGGSKPYGVQWNPDNVRLVNHWMQTGAVSLYRDALLISAWALVMPTEISAVLDAVRNRVLDLALGLEKVNPKLGALGEPVPPAAATIVNAHFHGGTNNVAIGSGSVTVNNLSSGDLNALTQRLTEQGVANALIAELVAELERERTAHGGELPTAPGASVLSWLGRVANVTGDVGMQIAAAASGNIVSAMVLAYYGL